jgi:hypothetical protein
VARFQGLALDELALGPRAAVQALPVELEPGAPARLPAGVLGADVWGRFDALLDLPQGVLVLHRTRLEGGGRCARRGEATAEACLEAVSRPGDGGVSAGVAVWRALPEGARVTFEAVGTELPCRVGFSFPPSGRGRSLWHRLPWPRLATEQPACAAALARATGLAPASFEEGSHPACPGLCAFAEDLASGRVSCQCQPARRSDDEAAARFLLRLRRGPGPDGGATQEAPEPGDP